MIPQLTLAILAYSGSIQGGLQEVPYSIPIGGNIFAKLILLFPV